MEQVKIAGYGWRPSLPDFRDKPFVPALTADKFAQSIDLRSQCPPVWDQQSIGSCTAHGVLGHVCYNQIHDGLPQVTPSRLFQYYWSRAREGSQSTDSGATVRDAVWVITHRGDYKESDWPYDISKFAEQPPTAWALQDEKTVIGTYYAVAQDEDHMLSCLSEGYPFIFGISVYSSFESDAVAQTGEVPMPGPDDGLLGGHCMLCVGYRSDGSWVARNSWGASWGDNGYCYLPKDYLLNPNLASDFWTLRSQGDRQSW